MFEGLVFRARSSQGLAQVWDLSDHGVAIDDGLVADVAGAGCVAQRVQCLLVVDVGWGHAGNHDSSRVPPQAVLHMDRPAGETARYSPPEVVMIHADGADRQSSALG